jgi:hypothetical protein
LNSGGKAEPKDVDINSKIRVDEGQFEERSEIWMAENQTLVRDAMRWIIFGAVLALIATGVFLFSEIRHAIVAKDYDTLTRIVPLPIPDVLADRRLSSDAQRPYLSLASSACMAAGIFIALVTVCTIVSSLLEAAAGYRYRGCWYIAALAAIVAAAVWSLLLLAAAWACVRPYPAAAAALAAAAGALALSTLDGPCLLLWGVITAAAACALTSYGGPLWVLDGPAGRPAGEKAPLLP